MIEDKLLIFRLKRGNSDALCSIYEKYRDDLLRLAAALLNNTGDAEDVVHDVFINFVRTAKNFRLTGSLKGYLSTCVANRARNVNVSKQRRKTQSLNALADFESGLRQPHQWIIATEQFGILNNALTQLPYEQREAIVLRLQAEMKFTQKAAFQQTSIKTVQSRYRYRLDKLRTLLNGKVK